MKTRIKVMKISGDYYYYPQEKWLWFWLKPDGLRYCYPSLQSAKDALDSILDNNTTYITYPEPLDPEWPRPVSRINKPTPPPPPPPRTRNEWI